MNRQQRRYQSRIVNVPVKDLVLPHAMSLEECSIAVSWRTRNNMTETGHPYHHRTANGVIVNADPTLEYLISRLEGHPTSAQFLQNIRSLAERADKTDLPKSIPVNRKYYGSNPYERH